MLWSARVSAACRSDLRGAGLRYHILVGGGFGPNAALGRDVYRDVKAQDAPKKVERILKAYMAHRASPQESFLAFAQRHEADALTAMFEREAGE